MSKNEQKPDFSLIIASAVHDMKNSLGMLLNSLDTLCDDLPEAKKDELNTATIRYEAERVNSFLVQLLGLYKLENQGLSLHIDEYFVSDLLEEQQAHYQDLLNNRGIELKVDVANDLNWYFDRELILGIINNALNNAARYTQQRIDLLGYIEDEQLVIEVHDDGPGYPQAMLEADPAEINNNINFKTGSTSLGLYFATMVARMHEQAGRHGEVELSNGGRLGGSVFKVSLP